MNSRILPPSPDCRDYVCFDRARNDNGRLGPEFCLGGHVSREDVLVQDCRGPSVVSGFSPTLAFGLDFAVTTSYKADRAFQVIADYTGIGHQVMERRIVSFVGTAANSKNGLSLAYDGHFARTASYASGEATITDIALHLVPSDADEVTITVDRDSSGLIETPEAVLLAYASRGLHTSLCSFFAGLKIGDEAAT